MSFGRMRVLAPDAAILRRREMEDRLNNAKHFLHEQKKANLVAEWEHKIQEKGQWLDKVRDNDEVEIQKKAALEKRRAKLAEMLHREEAQHQQEILQQQDAIASRRAVLMSKAHEKAQKREEERQKVAQHLRDLQFKESCDLLRQRQSQQRHVMMREEQFNQIKERQEETDRQHTLKMQIEEGMLSEDAKQALKHQQELAATRKKYLELKGMLDSQMAEKHQSDAKEHEEHEKDLQNLHRKWAQDDENARQAFAHQKQEQKALAHELQDLNRAERLEKARKADEIRKFEAERLEAVFKAEAGAEERDRAQKQAKREADRQYRMHLEASLRREVDDTAERDSLIEQANRVQQSREDAQKAAQNRARAKLMSDVTKNRKDQIETHALTREQIIGERRAEYERLSIQALQAEEVERAESEKLRREEIRYRMELQTQMAEKQRRLAMEKESAEKDIQNAKEAETEYLQKLNQALACGGPQTDFRRKKVDWYS